MDMNYIAEYGTRGALLDLSKVDTSKFVEGTVDSGKINGKLVGVNAGINSALIFANPKVFEKAKMDLPDDKTWTWDQMMDLVPRSPQSGSVLRRSVSDGSDALFGTFVRQHGKELFTEKGLGFDVAKLKPGTTSCSRA
jgi:multiple sugar transport system substrate-binding protein